MALVEEVHTTWVLFNRHDLGMLVFFWGGIGVYEFMICFFFALFSIYDVLLLSICFDS